MTGIISLATGVVTVAGFVVFDGTWVGTSGDLFAAFAWGFFDNFGLERITKLADPILKKALP